MELTLCPDRIRMANSAKGRLAMPFLFGEQPTELFLTFVDIFEIAFPIDERVCRGLSLVAFEEFAVPAEFFGMRGYPDVDGQASQHAEGALKVSPDSRITFRLDERYSGQQRQAAGAHYPQLPLAVADRERPRGAAARVAAGDMRRDLDRPDTNSLTVSEPVIDARRGI